MTGRRALAGITDAAPSGLAPTYVQSTIQTTAVGLQYPSAVTAGNTLGFYYSHSGADVPGLSVSGSATSWREVGTFAGLPVTISAWVAEKNAIGGQQTVTVTGTFNSNARFYIIEITPSDMLTFDRWVVANDNTGFNHDHAGQVNAAGLTNANPCFGWCYYATQATGGATRDPATGWIEDVQDLIHYGQYLSSPAGFTNEFATSFCSAERRYRSFFLTFE